MLRYLYILTLCIPAIVTGCSSDGLSPGDAAFLRGTWKMSGAIDSGHAWHLEYTFGDGEFFMMGYPPINKRGDFKLQNQKEEEYLLEISQQTGNPAPQHTATMRLRMDRAEMTLYIDGQGPFRKSP